MKQAQHSAKPEWISQVVLKQAYPVFAIEEDTHRLIYVSDVLRRDVGDVVGQTCHQAFWGSEAPCVFCPEKQGAGSRYCWECYDARHGQVYEVCTLWHQEDGQLYRVSTAADVSDITDLSRSVTDYLCLMRALSGMQLQIMDNQSCTMEVVASFLRRHFCARAVYAELCQPGGEFLRLICDADEHSRVPAPEESLDAYCCRISIPVLDSTCTFRLAGLKNAQEWVEDRSMVMSIVKPYLENELMRRRIEWENTHDRATCLRNRAAFRQDTQAFYRNAGQLSVLFLDIDNLKAINDAYGHDMGDRLISKAASVLLSVAGETVRVYRMGGDEFVAVSQDGDEAQGQALLQEIDRRIDEGNELIPMPQIGISKGMAHGLAPIDIEALLRTADQRMYEDKRRRKAGRA